jgi:hypothetical protein
MDSMNIILARKLFNYSTGIFLMPLVILLFILTSISGFGQISQPNRYEKKQKYSEEFYTIIPMKEEGIALLREKDKYKGNKQIWELIFLDTLLQEKHTTEFEVEMRHNLVGHEYTPGRVCFLFRTGDTNKNNLELFDFDISGQQKGYYEIKPELDFKLTHFSKAGDNLVLGGYVSKDPVVLIYEPATNHIKVVPGFFQKDNELVDLRVNQNQTFNSVVIDRSTKTEKKLVFRTFDQTGEMLLEDVVDIDDKKSLQTSITSALEREELMVLGTYGGRQSKQSIGFFALPIDPFGDQKIQYIDFSQLKHYFDYIKPARAKRIKENATEDIQAGRNPDYADYVMPFKVEENKKGFILLAEVYLPTTNFSQYNNPYGNPMYGSYPYSYYNPYMPYYYSPSRMFRPYSYGNNVKNTDEIRTSEAVVLQIDPKGNIVWDQSIKIEDVKRSTLEQVSDFHQKQDSIFFIYRNKDNELKVKKIEIENNEVSDFKVEVKLSEPFDEFRSERNEYGVRKWYGNSFYTWGYQTIRNVNNKEDRVRDVFFINKIVVH